MANILVGCRLPSGIILEVPGAPHVVLNGQRQSQEGREIILLNADDYGVTEVDESFFESWKKLVTENFGPLKNGLIFVAKNEKEAKAKNKDLKSKPTGHEATSQDAKDIEKAA